MCGTSHRSNFTELERRLHQMAKGHRSQIKRERNENQKDTRPSAKLSYARVSKIVCIQEMFKRSI